MKTKFTLLSSKYTWVHFTIFIVHFTPLENSMAANTCERRLRNYPQWRKASFLSVLQYTEEPLSQNTPYQKNLSYMSQWKDRCRFFFDSTSRPIKLNVKTTRNSHESWPFSFLSCVWIGIWHSYGFQMGFKMCPMFIQGNSLWIAHSVPFQKDLIHCCWGPLGYLDLSSAQR